MPIWGDFGPKRGSFLDPYFDPFLGYPWDPGSGPQIRGGDQKWCLQKKGCPTFLGLGRKLIAQKSGGEKMVVVKLEVVKMMVVKLEVVKMGYPKMGYPFWTPHFRGSVLDRSRSGTARPCK